MYPIFLDLTDRLVVIVGGGAVAARKAMGVIAAGGSRGSARIRAVAPDFSESMPASVERITDRYRPDHLNGAGLVFAATDSPDVNAAVLRDARHRGVFVCCVDVPEAGDFITPAIKRDGPITLAVSSAVSPTLSLLIRRELADHFDEGWRCMAEELQQLRPIIVNSELSPVERSDTLRSLATREAIALLEARGSDALRAWLVERSPKLQTVLDAARSHPAPSHAASR
ncbi:hypothetical protein BH09PLA1_BH09PLA1_31090 [soil metagenome]